RPPPPPSGHSTYGTILRAGSSGSLTTSAGTLTFGSGTNAHGTIILLNRQSSPTRRSSDLEVANGANLYAQVVQGEWDVWNGSGWGISSNPSGLPSSTPPPAPHRLRHLPHRHLRGSRRTARS